MLKDILRSKGMTQTTLAKKIGKSQRLVSCWCNGTCQPQINMLSKIAEALNISIEEVVNCFKK